MDEQITTCWRCIGEVPQAAQACKHCGADLSKPRGATPKRPTPEAIKVVAIVGSLLLALVVLMVLTRASPWNAAGANGQSQDSPTKAAEQSSSGWQYTSSRDEMRNATTAVADDVSENVLHFGFPYGDTHGHIFVRQRPQTELELVIGLDRGQFNCTAFGGSTVAIKFDDGPITSYACAPPSDGTPGAIFLSPAPQIVSQLLHAHRAVVEADFFQQGRQQLVFNVAGLNWPR